MPTPTVLQQCPEVAAGKQWEQTVTPTIIDSPPPTHHLTSIATLIPTTLNL